MTKYTVKRIVDGDISGFGTDDWTISRNGVKPGKTFLEAVALAHSPSPLSPLDAAPTLAELKSASVEKLGGAVEVQGVEVQGSDTAFEIGGVTVIRGGGHNHEDLVMVGANPGTRDLSEALGVVVSVKDNREGQQEVQYDFIYPGEQVYITDCHGNTVESLR